MSLFSSHIFVLLSIPTFAMDMEKLGNCVQQRKSFWDLSIKLYHNKDISGIITGVGLGLNVTFK